MFDKDNKFGFIINNNNSNSNNNIEGLDNIKTDINNIKSDVDELNTQYKDIVKTGVNTEAVQNKITQMAQDGTITFNTVTPDMTTFLTEIKGRTNLFKFAELKDGYVMNGTIYSIDDIKPATDSVNKCSNIITVLPNSSICATKSPRWDSKKLPLFDKDTRLGLNKGIDGVEQSDGTIVWTNNEDKTYLTRLIFSADSKFQPDENYKVAYGTTLDNLDTGNYINFSNLKLIEDNVPNNCITNENLKGDINYSKFDEITLQKLNIGDVKLLDLGGILLYCISNEDCDLYNSGLFLTSMDTNNLKIVPWDKSRMNGYYSKVQIVKKEVSTVTNYGSNITLIDNLNQSIYNGEKSIPIRIVPIPANPTTEKNVLCIGDSLFAMKTFPRTIIQNLNKYGLTNIKFVGRLQDSTEPLCRYEATGGYTWNNYLYNPSSLPSGFPNNYFWDNDTNDINISKYMTTYCNGVNLDYLIINLGINNKVNNAYSSDLDIIERDCKLFLDKLHTQYPNCKVILNGCHMGSDTNPDKSYREFAFNINNLYKKIATSTPYSNFVKYVPISAYFDWRIGMQTEQVRKSIWGDENDTFEVIIDEVHPNPLGYKMLAYADTCYMLALLNGE